MHKRRPRSVSHVVDGSLKLLRFMNVPSALLNAYRLVAFD